MSLLFIGIVTSLPMASLSQNFVRFRKIAGELVQVSDLWRAQFFGGAHLDVGGIGVVRMIPGAMQQKVVSGIGHEVRYFELHGRGCMRRESVWYKRIDCSPFDPDFRSPRSPR